MWSFTILLPIGVVVCLAYGLSARAGWRVATLTALAIAGALVVLLTELLSAAHAISRGPLMLSWAVALTASLFWVSRTERDEPAITGVLHAIRENRLLSASIPFEISNPQFGSAGRLRPFPRLTPRARMLRCRAGDLA